MKALGLAALMAKAGLPLPAEAPARLPAFSRVLADIGDEQSLTANLSTFSGHLKRIQGARAEADGKALLLLDELGTGTDPLEGAALGVALLKALVKGGDRCGALTVATTHHSVMTGLKFDDSRFENASVEFDEVALAPTYRLLWGVPGRSNALNIASRLGLDERVVQAARSRLDTGVASVNSAIEALEGLRGELGEAEGATWALDRDIRAMKQRLKAVASGVEKLHGKLSKARAAALLQVYTLARERIKQIKEDRRRLGRTAPPPKPILDRTAAAAVAAPVAAPAPDAAEADDALWPSEDEIWDAWEAKAAASAAAPPAAASAAAIGAPLPAGPRKAAPAPATPAAKAPKAATPAAATPAAAAAAAAAAVDPLQEIMGLTVESGGAGLEDLVDSLAARAEWQAGGEARRREEEEEALHAEALQALDDLDAAAAAARRAVALQEAEVAAEVERRRRAAEAAERQRAKAQRDRRERARGDPAAAFRSVSSLEDDGEEEEEDWGEVVQDLLSPAGPSPAAAADPALSRPGPASVSGTGRTADQDQAEDDEDLGEDLAEIMDMLDRGSQQLQLRAAASSPSSQAPLPAPSSPLSSAFHSRNRNAGASSGPGEAHAANGNGAGSVRPRVAQAQAGPVVSQDEQQQDEEYDTLVQELSDMAEGLMWERVEQAAAVGGRGTATGTGTAKAAAVGAVPAEEDDGAGWADVQGLLEQAGTLKGGASAAGQQRRQGQGQGQGQGQAGRGEARRKPQGQGVAAGRGSGGGDARAVAAGRGGGSGTGQKQRGGGRGGAGTGNGKR
ncbi:hypothetical protein HYH03_013878 [Edaphochlamys debaryana]|uniref:DNA mismatch repair proteins mutS family domain-containing protein n=1 Tax=Edaphochlamys debaryana TaxID=47281 RepID=A0A836BST8_9CHLO|nr:hypothetical protein HYH03_013878 [Edaphochlamys debaryana]|eukprot:KAG2487600.1 hypothetical protein HYH03_013878 [Edaphochlamys debaryana]